MKMWRCVDGWSDGLLEQNIGRSERITDGMKEEDEDVMDGKVNKRMNKRMDKKMDG